MDDQKMMTRKLSQPKNEEDLKEVDPKSEHNPKREDEPLNEYNIKNEDKLKIKMTSKLKNVLITVYLNDRCGDSI